MAQPPVEPPWDKGLARQILQELYQVVHSDALALELLRRRNNGQHDEPLVVTSEVAKQTVARAINLIMNLMIDARPPQVAPSIEVAQIIQGLINRQVEVESSKEHAKDNWTSWGIIQFVSLLSPAGEAVGRLLDIGDRVVEERNVRQETLWETVTGVARRITQLAFEAVAVHSVVAVAVGEVIKEAVAGAITSLVGPSPAAESSAPRTEYVPESEIWEDIDGERERDPHVFISGPVNEGPDEPVDVEQLRKDMPYWGPETGPTAGT